MSFLNNSAQYLGKIHTFLEDYNLPTSNILNNIFNFSRSESIYNELKKLTLSKNLKQKDRIVADLTYRQEILKTIGMEISDFNGLTMVNSHGDYSVLQLLTSDNDICGIVDFSRTSRLPAVWEIVRSYTIGAKECKDCYIDKQKFNSYLNNYQKFYKLNEKDLKSMYKVYILQLLSSSFGYREYINNNNEDLLQFGLWRTEMLKFMYNNEKELVNGICEGLECTR